MALDFSGLLDRKYANLEANTQGENALRQAQATSTLGALSSENALRNAQAFSTGQQGATLGPLAHASIAATNAGIGETQARAGLYGAQSDLTGVQATQEAFGNSPLSDEELLNHRDGLNTNNNFGLGGGNGLNPVLGAPGQGPSGPGLHKTPYHFNSTGGADGGYSQNYGIGSAGGATNVQKPTPSKGGKAAAPPQPQMGQGPQPQMGAVPLLHGDNSVNMHAVLAHAMNTLHAAGGATSVPSPGQTTSNGSWLGPSPAPAPIQPLPPTPLSGLDLARQLGLRAQMTSPTGVPPIAPPVAYPTPPGTPGGGFGTRTPLTGTVLGAAGGANDVQPPQPQMVEGNEKDPYNYYSKGTAKVPGKGPSNVDSVPATLAPGEAVLNSGAANHMGRGAIAALNALGAAHMAQAGMPPATPPTAHGMPMPARGAPAPGKMPPGRGMPPAMTKAPPGVKQAQKGPPPKVAAGKGAK